MQYDLAAYPLRIIHIVGIVAEWLVQYLKRTGTRFESQSGTTRQQPLPELCRNAADGGHTVQAAKPGPGVAPSTANAK